MIIFCCVNCEEFELKKNKKEKKKLKKKQRKNI